MQLNANDEIITTVQTVILLLLRQQYDVYKSLHDTRS